MISHDNGGALRGASTIVTAEAGDQPSSNVVFPILVRAGNTEEEEKEKLPSVSTDEGVNDETSDPVGDDVGGVNRHGITRSNHLSGRSPSLGMYDPKSCCRGYGYCDS